MTENKQEQNSSSNRIQNNIKTLSQVEADKKQKIIFKPDSDRFFQPLFLILMYFSIVLLTIGLIMSAYSYGTYSVTGSHILYEDHVPQEYGLNFPKIMDAAIILFISAGIFLICFIMRLFRGFAFISLNKEVKLKDVDSKLVFKFCNRFILYIFFLCAIVTVILIGITNVALFNNHTEAVVALKVLAQYWNIASIFAILSGSLFVIYFVMKLAYATKLLMKRYLDPKNEDSDLLSMINRRRNESYVKILINRILVICVYLASLMFAISLFIYGANGLAYAANYINDVMTVAIITNSFIQFSTAWYITGGLASLLLLYSIYALIINYKINNFERNKEEKRRKERARIEKINMKMERKIHKNNKNK